MFLEYRLTIVLISMCIGPLVVTLMQSRSCRELSLKVLNMHLGLSEELRDRPSLNSSIYDWVIVVQLHCSLEM